MKPDVSFPSIEKVVVQEDINMYAEASGDHNPLHLSQEFASATHFGRIVAHGMLVQAYISEMMSQAFGRNWLEAGRLKVRFRAPVYPGDRVTTFGEIISRTDEDGHIRLECSVGCRNEEGLEVVNGVAWVRIPNEKTRM